MKGKLLLLIFLVAINFVIQTPVEKLTNYIKKLGWGSFKIEWTSVSLRASLDTDARRIVDLNINRKEKYRQLWNSINENNAIVIHMILTEMVEPSKFILTDSLNYHKKLNGQLDGTKIDSVTYFLNGISWNQRRPATTTNYKVVSKQIVKMKNYWMKALKIKKM